MQQGPTIVWFRNDLRVSDHAPLQAAIERGQPIIPVYILDEFTPGLIALGGASRWWLHHSLQALDRALQALGSQLVLRAGPSVDVLQELCKKTKAGAVYFHKSVLPGQSELENCVKHELEGGGVDCFGFQGELLFEPESILSGSKTPYKVFTPFWRACCAANPPGKVLAKPSKLKSPPSFPKSEVLEDWDLLPSKPNWAAGFDKLWHPGEDGGKKALKTFLKGGVGSYHANRDYPALSGTSQLSAHLHFGEVSVRACWGVALGLPGSEAFVRQLGWREFCHYLLFHWPNLVDAPFRPEFAYFPWQENKAYIEAWQQGKTGYPIIDAGMRQLWQTGWMHNRVRMIVGSFLVKNLRQHWHVGRDWFWDALVDADLANNSAGWQWIAGCGADAAPYFRIFNPVTQSEKFDKQGNYIRAFVPELSDLPTKYLHDPSNAPDEILQQAGVVLGQTYPKAIVDLKTSRQQALEAYQKIKDNRV